MCYLYLRTSSQAYTEIRGIDKHIVVAENYVEALKSFAELRPSCMIIGDIILPDAPGNSIDFADSMLVQNIIFHLDEEGINLLKAIGHFRDNWKVFKRPDEHDKMRDYLLTNLN